MDYRAFALQLQQLTPAFFRHNSCNNAQPPYMLKKKNTNTSTCSTIVNAPLAPYLAPNKHRPHDITQTYLAHAEKKQQ
jgi:hypothetical protein